MLVPWVARHRDCIYQADKDFPSLRREISILSSRVRDLEQGWDVDEMRIIHSQNQLEETHSLV